MRSCSSTTRLARCVALAAVLCLISASPAFPWGWQAHRLINWYAVDNLPSEMIDDGSGNAFGDMRQYFWDHCGDSDWQKNYDSEESQRHWCNIDSRLADYPPPFDTVPRDYNLYVQEFGRWNGVIQWEGFRDHYDDLVLLMRAGNWIMAYQRAAELGHYVADSSCPLHCTENYDGQLSSDPRNRGIHDRYESSMVSRHITTINTVPGSAARVEDRVECGFDIISAGWTLVDDIMAADLAAQDIVGDYTFNDQYYQELYSIVGSDAQAQLDLAARRLADLWYTAWDDAGRPAFTPNRALISFQPGSSATPAGWAADWTQVYGPFGPYGWQ